MSPASSPHYHQPLRGTQSSDTVSRRATLFHLEFGAGRTSMFDGSVTVAEPADIMTQLERGSPVSRGWLEVD